MKAVLIAASIATLAVAMPASAQLYDTFDNENGGASQTNYTNFANFVVTSGSVDIVHQPDFGGLQCAGGSGSCVDLSGTTNQGGTITTKSSFNYVAGSRVTISFQLSGNQRTMTQNDFFVGANFSTLTSISNVMGSANSTTASYPDEDSELSTEAIGYTNPQDPFNNYSFSFTTNNAGSLTAFFGTDDNDNQGPLLDNVSVNIGAVPEPATWTMMVMGFGMVGFGLRSRRKQSARITYA